MITFLVHAHTSCMLRHLLCVHTEVMVGRGQVSTYRARDNKCRSFPLYTYLNRRLVDYWWCSLPAVCKTKLRAFISLLPHCTVHMLLLKTISLHFFRMNWTAVVFGPALSCLSVWRHHLQASNKHFVDATLDIPTFWCGVARFEDLWVAWPNIAFPHKIDPRFVRNWESNNPTYLYLQCSFVNIWPSSWLGHEWKFAMAVTPRNPLLRGAFSLENIRGPRAVGRITCEFTITCEPKTHFYLRKHKESEPEECGRISARRIFFRKEKDFGSSRPHHISIYNHIEPNMRFTWENTNLEGLLRRTFPLEKDTESRSGRPHHK